MGFHPPILHAEGRPRLATMVPYIGVTNIFDLGSISLGIRERVIALEALALPLTARGLAGGE
jgi:hypothetical protein